RVSARPFRIDVDQAHLDRRERAVEVLEPAILIDARLNALVDPLVLIAPVDVLLRLVDVWAAASEAEHRPSHGFDGDVPGEDEQIGPADRLSIFLLDRPQQAASLVEVAIVRPAVQRSKTLLTA